MMRTHLILLSLVISLTAMGVIAQDTPKKVDPHAKLKQHLRKNAVKPAAYLADKFKKHDVVVLGEVHMGRENCQLVAQLIKPLYHRAKVRCLASEFLRLRFTAEANKLLLAKEWHQDSFVDFMRQGPWPTWGYQEYLDIFKAIWQLNQSLPKGAEPFYLQGLDSDWTQYDMWFGKMDRRKRMQQLLAREETMIGGVEAGGIKAGRKTLVHIGFAHSVVNQGVRLATVLRKKYGQRLFQVALHQKFFAPRSAPPKGTLRMYQVIEKVCQAHGGGALGFDIIDSPFKTLRDDVKMPRGAPDMSLGALAEGYIFLVPRDQAKKVTWIKGFITPASFPKAKPIAERMGWVKKGSCTTAKELDARLAERYKE